MWLRWFLCVLCLLQLMVLSGVLAAQLYDIAHGSPPAPPGFTSAPPHPPLLPTARTKPRRTKPVVKMKAIPLAYLKQHIAGVTSRLDLVRLFTESNLDDLELMHWIGQTARAASLSGVGLKLTQPHTPGLDTRVDAQRKDHTVDGARKPGLSHPKRTTQEIDKGENDAHGEIITVDEAGNIKETIPASFSGYGDSFDADYFYDYPQDEADEEDLEAFEAALYHVDEMSTCSSSQCKDPKPFVQHVHDPQRVGRVFMPECTILHRCMNFTGCCGNANQECVPKSMSIVTKAFLIADRHSPLDDYVTLNPNMAVSIAFVNHTECECRDKPRLPKCNKTCPIPFRLTREGVACTCNCFPTTSADKWACESVKDGVKPLSHDGLVCIKSGNCYVPQCTVGEFDIKSGSCPLSDEYTLPKFLFVNPEDRRFYREHLRHFDLTDLGDTTNPTPQTPVPKSSKTPNSTGTTMPQTDRGVTKANVTEVDMSTKPTKLLAPTESLDVFGKATMDPSKSGVNDDSLLASTTVSSDDSSTTTKALATTNEVRSSSNRTRGSSAPPALELKNSADHSADSTNENLGLSGHSHAFQSSTVETSQSENPTRSSNTGNAEKSKKDDSSLSEHTVGKKADSEPPTGVVKPKSPKVESISPPQSPPKRPMLNSFKFKHVASSHHYHEEFRSAKVSKAKSSTRSQANGETIQSAKSAINSPSTSLPISSSSPSSRTSSLRPLTTQKIATLSQKDVIPTADPQNASKTEAVDHTAPESRPTTDMQQSADLQHQTFETARAVQQSTQSTQSMQQEIGSTSVELLSREAHLERTTLRNLRKSTIVQSLLSKEAMPPRDTESSTQIQSSPITSTDQTTDNWLSTSMVSATAQTSGKSTTTFQTEEAATSTLSATERTEAYTSSGKNEETVSQERSVLEGMYNYDYSVLEGSGEEFEYGDK